MNQAIDTIPVLTDIIEDDVELGDAPDDRTVAFLNEVEAHLAAVIHEHADELVHNACRELEALLLEQVSDRLREQLPTLIADVIAQHIRVPAGTA